MGGGDDTEAHKSSKGTQRGKAVGSTGWCDVQLAPLLVEPGQARERGELWRVPPAIRVDRQEESTLGPLQPPRIAGG